MRFSARHGSDGTARISPVGGGSTVEFPVAGLTFTGDYVEVRTSWARTRAAEFGTLELWQAAADAIAGGTCPELCCGRRFDELLEHADGQRLALCEAHPQAAVRLHEVRPDDDDDPDLPVGTPVIERRIVDANTWRARTPYR